MKLYEVIPERFIPSQTLIYGHSNDLETGTLIEINIRGKNSLAVVLRRVDSSYGFKVKEISKVYKIVFSTEYLIFLKTLSRQFFNNLNQVLKNYLQPLKLLSKSDWLKLENQKFFYQSLKKKNDEKNIDNLNKLNISLEQNILFRIMYIIRNKINQQKNPSNHSKNNLYKQFLIIVPEIKYLENYYNFLTTHLESEDKFDLFTYSSNQTTKSKQAVHNLIFNSDRKKNEIYLTTRSGFFLPFQSLTQLILVQESSPFYQQQQNGLYYDTREACFLFSKLFGLETYFLSTVPSGRLLESYKFETFKKNPRMRSLTDQKTLRIQISHQNSHVDDFKLFSNAVEQELSEK